MDVRGTVSRIRQFLENFPQPGPVEQIGIRLTGLSYGVGRQRSIFAEVRAQDSLVEDIKELELRLTSHLVFKIKEVEPWSRIPERRYALTRPPAGKYPPAGNCRRRRFRFAGSD